MRAERDFCIQYCHVKTGLKANEKKVVYQGDSKQYHMVTDRHDMKIMCDISSIKIIIIIYFIFLFV